ncbi:hypothetical protein TNCV_668131 [Trichonephila clavipes]|nr:hypothetical protein TNCV_668131 [Trichonephila clavipes]
MVGMSRVRAQCHKKIRRVGQRCTLNLSRTEMSSRWCAVVVRRGGASSGVTLIIWPFFKITRLTPPCRVDMPPWGTRPTVWETLQYGHRTQAFQSGVRYSNH